MSSSRVTVLLILSAVSGGSKGKAKVKRGKCHCLSHEFVPKRETKKKTLKWLLWHNSMAPVSCAWVTIVITWWVWPESSCGSGLSAFIQWGAVVLKEPHQRAHSPNYFKSLEFVLSSCLFFCSHFFCCINSSVMADVLLRGLFPHKHHANRL